MNHQKWAVDVIGWCYKIETKLFAKRNGKKKNNNLGRSLILDVWTNVIQNFQPYIAWDIYTLHSGTVLNILSSALYW